MLTFEGLDTATDKWQLDQDWYEFFNYTSIFVVDMFERHPTRLLSPVCDSLCSSSSLEIYLLVVLPSRMSCHMLQYFYVWPTKGARLLA